MGIQKLPRIIRLSVHIYRMLLPAYPRSFREAYSPHMVQVFGDHCLRRYNQKGVLGLFPLWGETLLDFIQSVIEEHLQKEAFMSKGKLTRLTGWFLVLAGFSSMFWNSFVNYLVANLTVHQPQILFFDFLDFIYLPLFSAIELTLPWLVFFGFYGVYMLYKNILGKLAPVSIAFIFFGALMFTLIMIAFGLDSPLIKFEILASYAPYFLLTFFGITGFGVVLAIHKPLPKFNYIILITYLATHLLQYILNSLDLDIMNYRGLILLPVIAIFPIGRIILGTILLSNPEREVSSGKNTPQAAAS